MAQLSDLKRFVLSGTAEGDSGFLDQVFIPPAQFANLCGIEMGGMRILVGNKGIGKSAILEWIARVSDKRKIPCVLVRPDNISHRPFPAAGDIGSLKHHYFDLLVQAIAKQIGSKLQGLLVGEKARLYEEARADGLTEEDFVQKVLALISAVSLPVTKINGIALAKELTGVNTSHALIKALNTQLLATGTVFILLIDDTDQIAEPDKPTHLNRLWALMLAVRRLSSECPAVRTIVSLRYAVWTRLTSESMGNRDQTDHLRGFVIPLEATDDLMGKIIRRRLERGASYGANNRNDPYPQFFRGSTMTLPMSDETRTWESFIIKSARERPRDAIQLIKNMIDSAEKSNVQIIGSAEAQDAMIAYSSERVDDLYNEFSIDCHEVREVINTFVALDFEIEFETFRAHVLGIPSSLSVTLRNKKLRPNDDDDALLLISFLHETGFINPRVTDSRMSRGFRHISFQDDPYFARVANWNKLQSSHWEVHPAFRTFLIGAKENARARIGR